MKVLLYYVVRIYNDHDSRIDSGPHNTYNDAIMARSEDHRWDAEKYSILETYVEGSIVD